MGPEAIDAETFPGAARRPSWALLASAAARERQWIIDSLDTNMTFPKGLTYQEVAEATGGKERMARFTLPPGSASALRSLPGFEHHD
eukprot:5180567-Pyramimonas_sp.AAC.1